MAAVRNLKILKGVLYADVQVAGMDNGGWVDLSVKVARNEDDAVTEALAQLNAAIVAIAERNLGQVATNAFLEKKIRNAMIDERRRHADALEVQRTTLRADVARRLRSIRSSFMGLNNIDSTIRKVLDETASEFEKAS